MNSDKKPRSKSDDLPTPEEESKEPLEKVEEPWLGPFVDIAMGVLPKENSSSKGIDERP